MILAIDSSVGTAVAVTDATGVERAAGSSADRRSHAESIGPLIAHALAEANLTAADVTAVVMKNWDVLLFGTCIISSDCLSRMGSEPAIERKPGLVCAI